MTNKCTKNKSHATHLGISARLTAVALTQVGDVSTFAKTLVETLNDVLQNLDATRSVNSNVLRYMRVERRLSRSSSMIGMAMEEVRYF